MSSLSSVPSVEPLANAKPTTITIPIVPIVRTGQAHNQLTRTEFGRRYRASFIDPAFGAEDLAIARLEEIAWQAYHAGRKAPFTQQAGVGYADPDYQLSCEWIATKQRIEAAQSNWTEASSPSKVLLICGSARNDGSCPGEMSKSFRLLQIAKETLEHAGIVPDVLDLSLITSEYGRNIFPCKGCASTAMPLCHWPCSCYPNHALNQTNDQMAEIYERWTAAHAVIIVTPVYWYQSPSPLKLMIDRLVCADGGNPDPTATSGKNASKAKELELADWPYPQHLAGRAYGLVVHGDVAGVGEAKRALSDWLDWMGLINAGSLASLGRYIGYYESYANSHEALDQDLAVQEETRNVARAVAKAVVELRAGHLQSTQAHLSRPRPK